MVESQIAVRIFVWEDEHCFVDPVPLSHMANVKIYFLKVSLLFTLILKVGSAWNTDNMEVYDVVEELNTNFYELFGISRVRFPISTS